MEKIEVPYGYIKDGCIFRSSGSSEDIQLTSEPIGDQKETIDKLSAKFQKFNDSLLELESKINNSNNKGSHLMKLLHIKSKLDSHVGLGDYSAMLDKINQLETLLNDIISKNRQRNTEIKQSLLLELDQVLLNNDLTEANESLKDIRSRWIKTGNPNPELKDSLEASFSESCQKFYDKKNEFREDKMLLVNSRIDKYKAINLELKQMLDRKDFLNDSARVKTLQKEWKEIGSIPQKDFKELNQDYWESCKGFFAELKKQKNKKPSKKDVDGLRSKKTDLINKLKSCNDSVVYESLDESLQEIKSSWKSTDRLDRKEETKFNDEFYTNLKLITEKAFIVKRANSKFKGFGTKTEKEKVYLLVKLTKELLRRDQNDLMSFEENMDNMHVNKGTFVDMLNEKLAEQRKKVELKSKVLLEWQSKYANYDKP